MYLNFLKFQFFGILKKCICISAIVGKNTRRISVVSKVVALNKAVVVETQALKEVLLLGVKVEELEVKS